jgi:hypothetical protein
VTANQPWPVLVTVQSGTQQDIRRHLHAVAPLVGSEDRGGCFVAAQLQAAGANRHTRSTQCGENDITGYQYLHMGFGRASSYALGLGNAIQQCAAIHNLEVLAPWLSAAVCCCAWCASISFTTSVICKPQ